MYAVRFQFTAIALLSNAWLFLVMVPSILVCRDAYLNTERL